MLKTVFLRNEKVLTFSGLPSILAINAEVSFRKFPGIELFDTLVVIFKCGMLKRFRKTESDI